MTNKEKFKEIFGIEPDCGRCNPYPCEENDCEYWEQCENQPGCACDDWWDWEFEEPTTKNDLGVDCISRADALALYCDKCGVYNCISKCSSYRAVEKMPSVTPQEPILDKIFCIIHPLSIISTPELEHNAIMQIAEMLEPLCLPESE